jgi:hypothetical protein
VMFADIAQCLCRQRTVPLRRAVRRLLIERLQDAPLGFIRILSSAAVRSICAADLGMTQDIALTLRKMSMERGAKPSHRDPFEPVPDRKCVSGAFLRTRRPRLAQKSHRLVAGDIVLTRLSLIHGEPRASGPSGTLSMQAGNRQRAPR